VYDFRQQVYSTTLTQGGTDLLGAFNVTFGQLTNAVSFGNLYDQYKIDYMEFTFRPSANANTLFANSLLPRLVTAIDKDDANTPSSLAAIEEYMTAQVDYNQQFTRRFRPGILSALWDGAVNQPAGSVPPPWIDCAATGIPHYGLKYGLEAGAAGQTAFQVWRVDVFVGIKFRAVR